MEQITWKKPRRTVSTHLFLCDLHIRKHWDVTGLRWHTSALIHQPDSFKEEFHHSGSHSHFRAFKSSAIEVWWTNASVISEKNEKNWCATILITKPKTSGQCCGLSALKQQEPSHLRLRQAWPLSDADMALDVTWKASLQGLGSHSGSDRPVCISV